MKRASNLEEFLNMRTDKSANGCWNWTSTTDKNSYGIASNNWLKKYGTPFAHRLMYIVTKGPIEKGLNINHHCDNPSCVNPDHLYSGTQKQNMNDKISRNRHIVWNRQFNSNQIKQIREMRKKGFLLRVIAERFNTSHPIISQICNYKTYKKI